MSTPDSVDEPMSIGVDLYRTDDYVKVGRVGLPPILRSVFEPALGQPLHNAQFVLTFHAVADQRDLDGKPSVVNLRSSHGYVHVRIVRDGVLLYQHPHSVRELVARPLQQLLGEQVPEETHWGFGIAGPGLERMTLVRPAPRDAGIVDLHVGGDRPRRFHLEPVPEPEPPEAGLTDFGISSADDRPEHSGEGVIFTPDAYEGFLRTIEFSTDVEEGGFLLGQVFRDRDRPGRFLIRIAEALPAERTGASLLQFTFTGESFLRVNDAIARRAGLWLVGWYHTHLFAASDNLGLSTIDVELHARTFLQRWHVAGLVNIDGGARQLRVYGWDGRAMHQLPYWIGPAWTP